MVIKLFDDNKKMKPLVSKIGWNILQLLKNEESYPLKIAKTLGIHEQKVYYHIKKLYEAGIISIAREEDIKGASAKFYAPTSQAYGLSLDKSRNEISAKILSFFNEFNKNGFSGKIIVGSPEPHGPLKAWAKDAHYSAMLSFFLGNHLIAVNPADSISLDADIKLKENYSGNFILIGGPGVNMLTYDFNEHFPARFMADFVGEAPSANFGKGFKSSKTGKEYSMPQIGVIQKIKNPHDEKSSIIVFAGVGKPGTYSAIYSFISNPIEILKDYDEKKDFCRIVEGNDLNGDGKIDSFEVIE